MQAVTFYYAVAMESHSVVIRLPVGRASAVSKSALNQRRRLLTCDLISSGGHTPDGRCASPMGFPIPKCESRDIENLIRAVIRRRPSRSQPAAD